MADFIDYRSVTLPIRVDEKKEVGKTPPPRHKTNNLTSKLRGELRKLGRSVNVSVKMNPDGSIIVLKSGSYFMTLEQSRNKAACYGASSVKGWANKIDAHLGKCSRGDYHKQYGEIEKQNHDMREKQSELRREDLVRAFDKARDDVRRGRLYFT